jgi:hypothetical protein
MPDVLTLGTVSFDDFSTPAGMGAGGKQAMVVHKLPGGQRVVDTLGPDEDNISWSGEFYGNDTDGSIATLDAMRIAGQVVPLTFAGQFRSVIIDSFTYQWRREPVWAEYRISCLVYQNPMAGALGAVTSTIDSLVLSDLSAAIGLL